MTMAEARISLGPDNREATVLEDRKEKYSSIQLRRPGDKKCCDCGQGSPFASVIITCAANFLQWQLSSNWLIIYTSFKSNSALRQQPVVDSNKPLHYRRHLILCWQLECSCILLLDIRTNTEPVQTTLRNREVVSASRKSTTHYMFGMTTTGFLG